MFLERNSNLINKLDRMIYSGSLLNRALMERRDSGVSVEAVRKITRPFFENAPKFGEWLKLSDRESWEREIKNLYEEQNEKRARYF
jgi:hypothetical protein